MKSSSIAPLRIVCVGLAASLVLAGCTDSDDKTGAAPDAGLDSGCIEMPSTSEPTCVQDHCFGDLVCVNGPCSYGCCLEGLPATCELPNGSECFPFNVGPPCGDGVHCAAPGYPCPDAGSP